MLTPASMSLLNNVFTGELSWRWIFAGSCSCR